MSSSSCGRQVRPPAPRVPRRRVDSVPSGGTVSTTGPPSKSRHGGGAGSRPTPSCGSPEPPKTNQAGGVTGVSFGGRRSDGPWRGGGSRGVQRVVADREGAARVVVEQRDLGRPGR